MKKNLRLAFILISALLLASCAKPLDIYEDETTKKQTTARPTETTKRETTSPTTEVEEKVTTEETTLASIEKIKSFETDKKSGYKVVKFGKYETSIGTTEPMEWLILDKDLTSYLLINRYVIDCKNYNEEDTDVKFKDSTLNNWLNNDFLDKAFTSGEQSFLSKVTQFGLAGGGVITIPDYSLCKNYFGEEDENKYNYKLSSKATSWAKSNYAEAISAKNSDYYDCTSFFLSDNGSKGANTAMWVGAFGHIYEDGQSVKLTHGDGVRPVLVVKKALFEDEEEIVKPEESTSINEEESTETEKVEETTIDKTKNIYKNTTSMKYKSTTAPTISDGSAIDINTEGNWEYGRTPLEWIYVAANYQIICNNKPNSSTHFSYKAQASTGELGCYIPIFTNSEAHGADYEGRFYSIEDYTKSPVDEMTFSNKFENLLYGDYKLVDLLKEKYEIGKISNGIWAANGEYINVVYVSELEEIIQNMNKNKE